VPHRIALPGFSRSRPARRKTWPFSHPAYPFDKLLLDDNQVRFVTEVLLAHAPPPTTIATSTSV
jgi:hypothetical protein